MRKGQKRILPEVKTEVLYRVAELWFREKLKASEIATKINEEFENKLPGEYTREAIYPLLQQARDLDFVRFVPPMQDTLSGQLHTTFEHPRDTMRVVKLGGNLGADLVTAAAAELVLEMICELDPDEERPVRLGLGPGRATLAFCHHLSRLLRSYVGFPRKCLQLHAITAGGANRHPENAPLSFFNLFPTELVKQSMGFFAESLATPAQFRKIKSRPTLKEVFDERDKIDIVITSRGDFSDEHDLLGELLRKEIGAKKFQELYGESVGNVQYRPYLSSQPLTESKQHLRAVTLFDLEDFVEMAAQPDKRVVLLARSCSRCGRPGADALRPLFEEPSLKVWSHVVMDAAVANGLLSK